MPVWRWAALLAAAEPPLPPGCDTERGEENAFSQSFIYLALKDEHLYWPDLTLFYCVTTLLMGNTNSSQQVEELLLIRPAGKTTEAQGFYEFIGSVLAVVWCPQQLADLGDRNNCRDRTENLQITDTVLQITAVGTSINIH